MKAGGSVMRSSQPLIESESGTTAATMMDVQQPASSLKRCDIITNE